MLTSAYIITLFAISMTLCALILINFIIKIFGFKFYGSTFFPLLIAFVLCYLYALVLNLYPIEKFVGGQPIFGDKNLPVSLAVSIFDAIKMFAISFDRQAIINYFNAGHHLTLFSIGYVITSFSSLLFASISVTVFTIKTFGAKIKTVWFYLFSKRDICYIFSDPRVPIATTIGKDLLAKKKNVIMVVTRSSQKTQEGTEYKDSLLMNGFNVRTENFSTGICRIIFRKFGGNKRVFVYGIFSNDDLSISLANNFQETIHKVSEKKGTLIYEYNKVMESIHKIEGEIKDIEKEIRKSKDESIKHELEARKAKKEAEKKAKNQESLPLRKKALEAYRNFKVFVTYHEADIDLNNNYSKNTNHIINTLSEYDIISTEFVLDNPIDLFVDIDHLDDVKEGSMNVSFLGFGKINRPIFEKMSSAYQLWGDNIHKVTYSILDRESKQLAEFCSNEYTSPKPEDAEIPFLYKVQAECDKEDLTEYNTIEKYIRKLKKDNARFSDTGFEHFIISVCDTNRDIKIATHLRKAIFKVAPNNLKRCRIYVRIANDTLAKNFINNNSGAPIYRLSDYNKLLLAGDYDKLKEVPIIVFGENALMSEYIAKRYEKMIKLAIGTEKSYYEPTGSEEFDYVSAEERVINQNKIQLLQNINASYNMHIKTKLLGYDLDHNFDVLEHGHPIYEFEYGIAAKIKLSKYHNEKDIPYNILKLAQLEHNRWVAASFTLHKFSKWDRNKFIMKNHDLDVKRDRDLAKNGFSTRTNDALHVCMLTNASLYGLKDFIDSHDFTFVSKDDVKKQSYKLVFSNDINQMTEMLRALKR